MFVLVSDLQPTTKDINNVSKEISKILYIVPDPDVLWENFGMALLNTDDNNVLAKFKGDYADRCKKLLDYWKTVREGVWDQVISALEKQDELKVLAKKLDEDLKSLKQQNPKQPSQGKS